VKEFGIVSRPCIYFAPFVRWLRCGFLAASFLTEARNSDSAESGLASYCALCNRPVMW